MSTSPSIALGADRTMDSTSLETDYLVIGTGATAMAFVDTLLEMAA